MERNQIVFDIEQMAWCRIKKIRRNTAIVEQVEEWDNDTQFQQWSARLRDLYEVAEGVTGKDGLPVCIEKNPALDYEYYSPSMDENFYKCELC